MTEPHLPSKPNPKVFWPLAIAGWAVLGYGVVGVLTDGRTNPPRWAIWFFGAAVVHDFLVAPLVLWVGKAIANSAPEKARGLLQAGLIMSAVVTLTATPVLLGFGRNADNPSSLPNDYGMGLLSVIAGVWVLVTIVALVRRPTQSRIRQSAGRK